MKKYLFLIIMILFGNNMWGETADEIIKKVDENLSPDSVEYNARMIIYKNKKEYIKKIKIYSKGPEKAFVRFLYPARDKDTKYLRVDDNLWMYLPNAERTIKISGHMLRQSMMGSDLSYEDQTSRNKLDELYSKKLLDENEKYYIIELIVKPGQETSYYRRKIWVEKNTYIPEISEMYAESGKIIKKMKIEEIKEIEGINYPVRTVIEDLIRKDSQTVLIVDDIIINKDIDDTVFTLRNLERKVNR